MKRTSELSSQTGVLEVARCESLTTLGRETLIDALWPGRTAGYKEDRNPCGSMKESAGFIVPLEAEQSKSSADGKGPYFSYVSSKQLRRF